MVARAAVVILRTMLRKAHEKKLPGVIATGDSVLWETVRGRAGYAPV